MGINGVLQRIPAGAQKKDRHWGDKLPLMNTNLATQRQRGLNLILLTVQSGWCIDTVGKCRAIKNKKPSTVVIWPKECYT